MTIAIILTLQEDQCDTITFVDYHFNTIVILLSETFMKIYNMVRLFNTYGYPFFGWTQEKKFRILSSPLVLAEMHWRRQHIHLIAI